MEQIDPRSSLEDLQESRRNAGKSAAAALNERPEKEKEKEGADANKTFMAFGKNVCAPERQCDVQHLGKREREIGQSPCGPAATRAIITIKKTWVNHFAKIGRQEALVL